MTAHSDWTCPQGHRFAPWGEIPPSLECPHCGVSFSTEGIADKLAAVRKEVAAQARRDHAEAWDTQDALLLRAYAWGRRARIQWKESDGDPESPVALLGVNPYSPRAAIESGGDKAEYARRSTWWYRGFRDECLWQDREDGKLVPKPPGEPGPGEYLACPPELSHPFASYTPSATGGRKEDGYPGCVECGCLRSSHTVTPNEPELVDPEKEA